MGVVDSTLASSGGGQALVAWAKNNGWTLVPSATTGPAVKYGEYVWKENRGTDTEKNISFGITQSGQPYSINTGNPVQFTGDKAVDAVTGQVLPESPNQNHVIRNIGLIAAGVGGVIAAPIIAGALAGGAGGGGAAAGSAGGAALGGGDIAAGTGLSLGAGAGAGAGTAGTAAAASTPAWLKAATGIGQVVTQAGKGAAEGRLAQNQANVQQDTLAIARARLAAELNAQRITDTNRLDKQVVAGDIQHNIQPFKLSVPGVADSTSVGGYNPSALGPNSRQAGATMSQNALADLVAGKSTGELSTVPQATPQPQASWVSKAMSILGPALQTYGMVNGVDPNDPYSVAKKVGGK